MFLSVSFSHIVVVCLVRHCLGDMGDNHITLSTNHSGRLPLPSIPTRSFFSGAMSSISIWKHNIILTGVYTNNQLIFIPICHFYHMEFHHSLSRRDEYHISWWNLTGWFSLRPVNINVLFLICSHVYFRASEKNPCGISLAGKKRFSAFSQILNYLSMQLKLALEIEYNICKSANKEKYFLKYKFVYDLYITYREYSIIYM